MTIFVAVSQKGFLSYGEKCRSCMLWVVMSELYVMGSDVGVVVVLPTVTVNCIIINI